MSSYRHTYTMRRNDRISNRHRLVISAVWPGDSGLTDLVRCACYAVLGSAAQATWGRIANMPLQLTVTLSPHGDVVVCGYSGRNRGGSIV